MRALLGAVAIGATIFLVACDSLPSRVQDRFSAVPARTQVVAGSQREVFHAAQGALKRLDFQLSRAAEAQGIVNGFSRIRAGDGPRESRQYTLEIRLNGLGPAETEVSVLVREQIEGGITSGIGSTDMPLRQHGLYETFFAMLRKTVADKSSPPPDEKKR